MSAWPQIAFAPHIAFAVVLGLSAGAGVLLARRARANARLYLQFAASLYVAFAIANGIAAVEGGVITGFFAGGLGLFVSALAPLALVLGIASAQFSPLRTLPATIILLSGLCAALMAAATAAPALAFVPLFVAACAMAVMASRLWVRNRRAALNLIVSACSLVAGAAAFMSGGAEGRTAMGLFAAAALLGVATVLGERVRKYSRKHIDYSRKRVETTPSTDLRSTMADRLVIRRGR